MLDKTGDPLSWSSQSLCTPENTMHFQEELVSKTRGQRGLRENYLLALEKRKMGRKHKYNKVPPRQVSSHNMLTSRLSGGKRGHLCQTLIRGTAQAREGALRCGLHSSGNDYEQN